MENPKNSTPDTPKKPHPRDTWRGWFRYFQYNEENDNPSDVRNVLLVVAALITAVTFQAGVNPPGGVWQEDNKNKTEQQAGTAIFASQSSAYYVFLISNTLAISTSILIIVSLTYKFPLHFEIWVATISMIVSYGSAVFAVTPNDYVKFRFVLFAASLPLILRCCIQTFKKIRSMEKPSESCHDPEKQDKESDNNTK